MNQKAPILLFTYKRLDALKKTIAALNQDELSKQSNLFIFSDGPKHKKDIEKVGEVRNFLKDISGFKHIYIEESKTNRGLANSVISGVSEVMKLYDRVIVLEDDLITTSNFLTFMNAALSAYEEEQKVFSISGYSMNLNKNNKKTNETYFLNRGWSWGWATWRNRWTNVDWEMKDYAQFKKDKKEKAAFALGGSDLNKMLRKQMNGKLDSWAIRWFYHQYKVSGLTLYPVCSKVYNNGFDKLATHTTGSNSRYIPLLDEELSSEIIFPKSVALSQEYQKAFLNNMSFKARLRSKIESIFQTNFKIK